MLHYQTFGAINLHYLLRNFAVAAALAGLLQLALGLNPSLTDRLGSRLLRFPTTIVVIFAAALFPIGWRLALLPWRAVPQPNVHDEFTHLLVADTLTRFRFANPAHALWRHFDTTYVLQQPAYAASYPIGQGVILAVGIFLAKNPWIGIVLSTALMCGAIAWAVSDLLPLGWTALGVFPVTTTYAFQWLDSYWGGSFCAFGGALLFGSLLRLRRSPTPAVALSGALGWSVVWFTRPFESVLLFLLLWGSVAMLATRAGRNRNRWIVPITVILVVQAGSGLVTLMHNHAVTGSFTTLPYVESQRMNGVPQSFAWQAPIRAPEFRYPEMKEIYWWQYSIREAPVSVRAKSEMRYIWLFFIGPWFTLPALLALADFRNRTVVLTSGLLVCAAALSLLYPFFFPHYFAAYSVVFAFLIARGLMLLSRWSSLGRPIGRWFASVIIVGGILYCPLQETFIKDIFGGNYAKPNPNTREAVIDSLEWIGGKHVVFVRYGMRHSAQIEWVYNAADIDAAAIVWCRSMGFDSDKEVMRYYGDRQFWIVDVDGEKAPINLARYDR